MAASAKRTKTIIARRQDLIRGTIQSVARLGYANSTVQTICEAAGLSRGLIGHYFKGKDELLLEAFRHMTAEADEAMRKAIRAVGEDPLQRLKACVATTFRFQENGEPSVGFAFWAVARWNPEMLRLHRRLWRRYRRWVERMMAAAAAERGLQIDARKAALLYAQMLDGFWLGWVMDEEAYSPKEAEETINAWLMDLFGEAPRLARPEAELADRPAKQKDRAAVARS